MNITEQEFLEIFDDEESCGYIKNRALIGLNIISKYIKDGSDVLTFAEHDVIHSIDIDTLIENGITEDDSKKLNEIGWMIGEDNIMSCFT